MFFFGVILTGEGIGQAKLAGESIERPTRTALRLISRVQMFRAHLEVHLIELFALLLGSGGCEWEREESTTIGERMGLADVPRMGFPL